MPPKNQSSREKTTAGGNASKASKDSKAQPTDAAVKKKHTAPKRLINDPSALNAKNKDYLTARGVIDPWKSGPELAHLKKKRPQSPNNPDPMSHISKKPKTKSGDVAASLPAQKQPGLEPDTRKLDGMLSKMYHLDNLERALNQPKRVAECIAKKRKLAQDILEEAERVGCL